MGTQINSTGITFPDNTTQNTAATAVTTTVVLNATAGASVGAVGTYALCYLVGIGGTFNAGDTIAGSNLRYGATAAGAYSGTPSGTWRVMGYIQDAYYATVFLRIS